MAEEAKAKDDRPGRIQWHEFYMGAAILAAQRSNDKVTQVGAVLVDRRRRIIGIGWNGMPTGCSDANMPWETPEKKNPMDQQESNEDSKHSYVCHAEANAFAFKTSEDMDGATLYTTLFPCSNCAKLIIQFGLQYKLEDTIYYLSNKKKEKPDTKASAKILRGEGNKMAVDFNEKFKITSTTPALQLDFTFMDVIRDGEPAKRPRYTSPPVNVKDYERPGRISWEDYFMGMAILAAKRSNHRETQVGAVLVDEQKRIVGIGWNGLPAGQEYKDLPKGDSNGEHIYDTHAEANAIIFKTCSDIRGTKLYTTLFPCNECTKLIIQSGVAEVHYLSDRKADEKKYKASRVMYDKKGGVKVKLMEYKLSELRRTTPLELDFYYLDREASPSTSAAPMGVQSKKKKKKSQPDDLA